MPKQQPTPLIFIDTNILLDFYRSRTKAGLELLAKIDGLHDSIITTCQVEMEFKKNRQKVIAEAVGKSSPQEVGIQVPAFLREAVNVQVIQARRKEVAKRLKKIDDRILRTLRNPKTQDKVYQTAQRLFSQTGRFNLKHDSAEYRRVWRRALRRFFEGKPPRKKDDLSIGDSINWEWIVECVTIVNRDVVIVSRDADYGWTSDDACEANTWLVEELKERCNQRRKVILVDKLTEALRLTHVPVKRTEVASEQQIIRDATISGRAAIAAPEPVDPEPLADSVISAIEEAVGGLVNSDPVSGEIASSNATGWGLDTFDVTDVEFENGRCTARVEFSFSGEQDDNKPWCGTLIDGECVAEVDEKGQVTLSNITAERDLGEEDEPLDEPLDEPPDEQPHDGPPPDELKKS